MLNEVISGLNIKSNGIYVDGTLGKGGHTKSILKQLSNKGLIIGIDRDLEAINFCNNFFKNENTPLSFHHDSYDNFNNILDKIKIKKVDGIFLDLGLSSIQLNSSTRGFSYNTDSVLDMRFDKNQKITASHILNNLNIHELSQVLYKYSEDRRSRLIARKIIKLRPLSKVSDLVEAIRRSTPPKNRIKTFSRIFQAIRIKVNEEIIKLEQFLSSFIERLKIGGRIVIISFHSIEDRLVKHDFKSKSKDGHLLIHTKKPITPSEYEIKKNRRSRSAKLRIAEKIINA
tara:strand:- start:379 stop:1236 length:858 start_codon:yes stop_codon:yes gene_type:complete